MVIATLTQLFNRDLNKLKTEIEAYQNEAKLWHIENHIANSAGNLCLHLVGNLNAFIGAEIGKTGYIRHRDQEFSMKYVPKQNLLNSIDQTIQMVNNTFENLNEEDLEKEYPIIVFKEKMSTGYFLIHLATHLAYHLGQINYHRRLLDT